MCGPRKRGQKGSPQACHQQRAARSRWLRASASGRPDLARKRATPMGHQDPDKSRPAGKPAVRSAGRVCAPGRTNRKRLRNTNTANQDKRSLPKGPLRLLAASTGRQSSASKGSALAAARRGHTRAGPDHAVCELSGAAGACGPRHASPIGWMAQELRREDRRVSHQLCKMRPCSPRTTSRHGRPRPGPAGTAAATQACCTAGLPHLASWAMVRGSGRCRQAGVRRSSARLAPTTNLIRCPLPTVREAST